MARTRGAASAAMESWVFLKGIAVGIAVAAPVGPVGLLCVQRTLQDGLWVGLASGLGAATADGIFSAIAGFGLAAVAGFLTEHRDLLRLVGGAVLFLLAWRAWRRAPPEMADAPVHVKVLSGFATGLAITLSNPMTIMGFVGIFAGFGLGELQDGVGRAGELIIGVFIGSAMWWLGLCAGTAALKPRFGPQSLAWTNRMAAVMLVGFGIFAIGSVLVR
ncbi:lysine transporter LysE [Ferruginivarius sediminum]|uniref:Lysine transporter LysE n=2 Tax=Ferruginivarius sediminum TaxID=2661937 RepID=A0A369TBI8_9PROT|nr:lysine transporter LysE [Ferruginivarius sediminum]